MKKLTQGMSEHNKAMSAAKTDEEKASVVSPLTCNSLIVFSMLFAFRAKCTIVILFFRKQRSRILQPDLGPVITYWR